MASENSSFKFFVIVLVGVVALFCIYYFTNRPRNNEVATNAYESFDNVDSEDFRTQTAEEINQDGVDYQTEVEEPTQKQLYRMAHAQDFPPETRTKQVNNPPLVGQGLQASLSKDPAMKQLRQAACFPKEQLTPEELKPQDNSSLWAQVNPEGAGSLKGRSFLQAGHHVGINTVGQTLRNANLQLRSEPPCPQVKVSPWMQTTIEPDVNRKPFEIGGCA